MLREISIGTTCQFQIRFISRDYLQMYKKLQLITNTFTFTSNTNKFTSIKVIKNTFVSYPMLRMNSVLIEVYMSARNKLVQRYIHKVIQNA